MVGFSFSFHTNFLLPETITLYVVSVSIPDTTYEASKKAALIKVYIKDNATGFPTSVSLNLNFNYLNEVMDISITKVSIGKLPLPLSVLKLYLNRNVTRIENSNSAIKYMDESNLRVQLDLNSLLAKKQKLLIIKNMSSESNLLLNIATLVSSYMLIIKANVINCKICRP